MNLEACLPPELRGATIVPVAAGLSGAGVYKVGDAHVLKVSTESADAWQRKLAIVRAAADAGVAPRVVHSDEERRAIVSEYVVDRGLMPRLMDPRTRGETIALLGHTLRRVHELPIAPGTAAEDPRELLRTRSAACTTAPSFVADAVRRALAERAPDAAVVLSHNDVNPSNLVCDGERLLLVDWDVAGVNDPYYDLATIAMFLRLDPAACMQLVAAHDGGEPSELPPRFVYDRRLVAVLCGVTGLALFGYSGGEMTLDEAPALVQVYQRMRSGERPLTNEDGRRAFALALVKESFSL